MNNKQHFDFLVNNGILDRTLAVSRVRLLCEQLLNALKIPCVEGMTLDKRRLKFFEIDHKEPVNWASIKVAEVDELSDGTFLVTVDEASPGVCPTLCDYIERYMFHYGWEVEVKTEW